MEEQIIFTYNEHVIKRDKYYEILSPITFTLSIYESRTIIPDIMMTLPKEYKMDIKHHPRSENLDVVNDILMGPISNYYINIDLYNTNLYILIINVGDPIAAIYITKQ